MNNFAACKECEAIALELREACADAWISSDEESREAWIATYKLIGGTEDDAVRAEELVAAAQFRPRRSLRLQLPHEPDRFIPVRSDESRIMTCFLEFENADSVAVHDLVHMRQDSGWSLNKSSYRKLRLGIEWVREELSKAGFDQLSEDLSGRLIRLAAVKP